MRCFPETIPFPTDCAPSDSVSHHSDEICTFKKYAQIQHQFLTDIFVSHAGELGNMKCIVIVPQFNYFYYITNVRDYEIT